MTEIFPSLVDSICVDSRKMLPPPLLGDFVEDKTGHVSVDSTKATNEQKIEYRKWQKKREEVDKDTSSVIIAFDPFLKKNEAELNQLLKEYNSKIQVFQTSEKGLEKFRFDFEKIKLNNKFKIKNISEFPKLESENRNLLYELKYDFVFSGILQLSRIQFDKQKQFGILEGSFSFCGKCGRGFNIFIKKINNKWVIDKIEGTWIS
ncbi:hypothetical protein [Flavobacterium alvei]|uniref:hypothetical protein n=1 Tax=Flavobacterium alvei TaxID=2080416 RepID=UPI0026EFCB57|nr:hypothetical protein [Flavobacterium alvei]